MDNALKYMDNYLENGVIFLTKQPRNVVHTIS